MENLFSTLVILFGLVGFLSPCTWNLNAILMANIKEKGKIHLFYFLSFRAILFTVLGFLVYLIGFWLKISLNTLIIIHFIITGIFFFGSPLMKKFKIAPFDLSLQALFPNLKIPAGVSIGLNFPYCSFPFFILVESYGLYLGGFYPLIFSVVFAIVSGVPVFLSFLLRKETFKKINEFIPAIPYLAGFIVLLTGFYLLNQNIFATVSLFDFVHEKHALYITIIVSFFLGALTSTGPATLPFIPVVAGMLVSNVHSKIEIFKNVFAFTTAFVLSHILVALVSYYGFMIINELFNVQLFNIILGIILLALGVNFLGFLNLSINLPKFKFTQEKGFFGSFILGLVYTFSICPSCTGFLLGAVALSVATENLILAIITMVVYALGRSLIIFILGFLFNIQSIQQFIVKNYSLAKKFTGFIFIVLAVYFIQKGLLL